MKHPNQPSRLLPAVALCLACNIPAAANAVVIGAGLDYFETVFANFDFGGPIGPVAFDGYELVDPFDTNNLGVVAPPPPGSGVDTIVERKTDTANIPLSGNDTIDIELVALSLRSVDPVNLGGNFFDVFVTLDLGVDLIANNADDVASNGTMTINLDSVPDGTNAPEGTFGSTFNINADAFFVPVGVDPVGIAQIVGNAIVLPGQADQSVDITKTLASISIPWSTTRDGFPRFLHEGPNFFPVGNGLHVNPDGTIHEVKPIPEPATLLLLGGALAMAGFRFRCRKAASQV